MMGLIGSSTTCPSNFGISKESLVDMVGQVGLWAIRLLINLLKLRNLRSTMYGKHGGEGGAYAILAHWGK